MVSFNLDQLFRPAVCADRWKQDGPVPGFLNSVIEENVKMNKCLPSALS